MEKQRRACRFFADPTVELVVYCRFNSVKMTWMHSESIYTVPFHLYIIQQICGTAFSPALSITCKVIRRWSMRARLRSTCESTAKIIAPCSTSVKLNSDFRIHAASHVEIIRHILKRLRPARHGMLIERTQRARSCSGPCRTARMERRRTFFLERSPGIHLGAEVRKAANSWYRGGRYIVPL